MEHPSLADLHAGLEVIRGAPTDDGRVELVVCRPAAGERVVLAEAVLDPSEGLVGDTWRTRGSRRTADGSAHPWMQLTIMSARVAALVAGPCGRWELAGDQLYVDLDLSGANLAPGTRLAVGTAVVEVGAEPHRGCAKFAQRFGTDAVRFVNSPVGRELNLRGVNTRVVEAGAVRPGDAVRRLPVSGPVRHAGVSWLKRVVASQ